MAQSIGKGFRTLPKIGSNCKHPPVYFHSRCCEGVIDRDWRHLMNGPDSVADHAGLFCIVCSIASCQNDHYQIPDDEILAATVFKEEFGNDALHLHAREVPRVRLDAFICRLRS